MQFSVVLAWFFLVQMAASKPASEFISQGYAQVAGRSVNQTVFQTREPIFHNLLGHSNASRLLAYLSLQTSSPTSSSSTVASTVEASEESVVAVEAVTEASVVAVTDVTEAPAVAVEAVTEAAVVAVTELTEASHFITLPSVINDWMERWRSTSQEVKSQSDSDITGRGFYRPRTPYEERFRSYPKYPDKHSNQPINFKSYDDFPLRLYPNYPLAEDRANQPIKIKKPHRHNKKPPPPKSSPPAPAPPKPIPSPPIMLDKPPKSNVKPPSDFYPDFSMSEFKPPKYYEDHSKPPSDDDMGDKPDDHHLMEPEHDHHDHDEKPEPFYVYYHDHHPDKTTTTTEAPAPVDHGTYAHYIGLKLWYIPLVFSVYFSIYCIIIFVNSIARHRINDWPYPLHTLARSGDGIDEAEESVKKALEATRLNYRMGCVFWFDSPDCSKNYDAE